MVSIDRDAHPDAFVCHTCGEKLSRRSVPAPTRKLKIKDEPGAQELSEKDIASTRPPPESEDLSQPELIEAARKQTVSRQKKQNPLHPGGALFSWILFIVIGGAAGFARYGGMLQQEYLDYIPKYGPLLVIALHIVVLLKAFTDQIFHGILCLLVPPYSMYYLLGISDDFTLRAVVAGLLVGIGQDSFLVFQEYGSALYQSISGWIASGG